MIRLLSAVLTMADQSLYPSHFGPAITSPALINAALWTIISGELLVGILGLKGAFDMLMASGAIAEKFDASKKFAVLACGVAMIVWFSLFMAFGGAYFQMWQTQLGGGALEGAFMYAVSSGVILVFINQPDP